MTESALQVLWVAEGSAAARSAPAFDGNPGVQVELASGLEGYSPAKPCDALVISVGSPAAMQALLNWAALSSACGEVAVIVYAPSADEPVARRLIQSGAQDVVLHEDAASLLPRLRWAVERKRVDNEARKAYATDLMTGLPNRQQFIEHMSQLIALRERENATVNLLVLRVDGLGGVESGHGRESANVVRRKIAVRLRAGLRSSDVVASLGADVFAVLLPSTVNPPDVQRVVLKLMRALREPFSVAGQTVAVRGSVGTARYPQDGKQPDELLRHASAVALSSSYDGGAANE